AGRLIDIKAPSEEKISGSHCWDQSPYREIRSRAEARSVGSYSTLFPPGGAGLPRRSARFCFIIPWEPVPGSIAGAGLPGLIFCWRWPSRLVATAAEEDRLNMPEAD